MAKSEAIKELERLALEANRLKFPNLPESARYIGKFSDTSANGLTKCVIDFIRLNGFQAERINCTGRMVDHTQVVSDVIGRKRIGSKTWIPTSGQRGTSDISAILWGKSVKIEVKIKDKQSEYQKEYQRQVEASGGIYMIVRNFNEFYNWFKSFGNGKN